MKCAGPEESNRFTKCVQKRAAELTYVSCVLYFRSVCIPFYSIISQKKKLFYKSVITTPFYWFMH